MNDEKSKVLNAIKKLVNSAINELGVMDVSQAAGVFGDKINQIDPMYLRSVLRDLGDDFTKVKSCSEIQWMSGFTSANIEKIYNVYSPESLTKNNKALIEKAIGPGFEVGYLTNTYSKDKALIRNCANRLEKMLDAAKKHKNSGEFFPHKLPALADATGPEAACINHAYNRLTNPEGTARFSEDDTNELEDLISTLNDNTIGDGDPNPKQQANINKAIDRIRQIGAKDDAKTLILDATHGRGLIRGLGMSLKGVADQLIQKAGVNIQVYQDKSPKAALLNTLNCKEDFIDFCKTKSFRNFIKQHTSDGVVNAFFRSVIGLYLGNINTLTVNEESKVTIDNYKYQRIINLIPDILKKAEEAIVLENSTEQLDGLLGALYDLQHQTTENPANIAALTYHAIQVLSNFTKTQDVDTQNNLGGIYKDILESIGITLEENEIHNNEGRLMGDLLLCLEKLSQDDVNKLFELKDSGASSAYLLQFVQEKTELITVVGKHASLICTNVDRLKQFIGIKPEDIYMKDDQKLSECLNLVGNYAAVNDGKDLPGLVIPLMHFLESEEPLKQYEDILASKSYKENSDLQDCKKRFEVYRKMFKEDPPLSKYDYAYEVIIGRLDQNSANNYRSVIKKIYEGNYEAAKGLLKRGRLSSATTKKIDDYINIRLKNKKYVEAKEAGDTKYIDTAYFALTSAQASFTGRIRDDKEIAIGDFDLFLHDFLLHSQERIDRSEYKGVGVLYQNARSLVEQLSASEIELDTKQLTDCIDSYDAPGVVDECADLLEKISEMQISKNVDIDQRLAIDKIRMHLDYFIRPPNMGLIEQAVDMLLRLNLSEKVDKEALNTIADIGLAVGILHQWQLKDKFSVTPTSTSAADEQSKLSWLAWLELLFFRICLWVSSKTLQNKPNKDILSSLKSLIHHIRNDEAFASELTHTVNSNLRTILSLKEISELEPQISGLIRSLIEHINSLKTPSHPSDFKVNETDEKKMLLKMSGDEQELGILVKGVISYFINDTDALERYHSEYCEYKAQKKSDDLKAGSYKMPGVNMKLSKLNEFSRCFNSHRFRRRVNKRQKSIETPRVGSNRTPPNRKR